MEVRVRTTARGTSVSVLLPSTIGGASGVDSNQPVSERKGRSLILAIFLNYGPMCHIFFRLESSYNAIFTTKHMCFIPLLPLWTFTTLDLNYSQTFLL